MTYPNGGARMHPRHTWSRRFSVLTLGLALLGTACTGRSVFDPAAIRIGLQPAAGDARPASVTLTGVPYSDLSNLRAARLDDTAWESLLRVAVDVDPTAPAVLGHYAVTTDGVTFVPRFPFNPGRTYHVTFNPARLPTPREAGVITAEVGLPAVATTPTTVVTAVHPSAPVLAENLLRMYIQFSAPMGSLGANDFVRLVDVTGSKPEVVDGAFLPVEANFWSPDHTRYTLLLDPGRVKLGILPNRQQGRPLRAGHKYALEISSEWTDGNRLPLKEGFRHEFQAGPSVKAGMDMATWRIVPPAAGSRDALVVTFPRPIDHAVVMRALGVETSGKTSVRGVSSIEDHDTRWTFVPTEAWRAGGHALVALSYLEDPQGNQIGHPFEEIEDEPRDTAAPDAYRVTWSIAQ